MLGVYVVYITNLDGFKLLLEVSLNWDGIYSREIGCDLQGSL